MAKSEKQQILFFNQKNSCNYEMALTLKAMSRTFLALKQLVKIGCARLSDEP